MTCLFVVVFLISTFFGGCVHAGGWEYEGEKGPAHWGDDYPACSGNRQSPIKIETAETEQNLTLGRIVFSGYDQPLENVSFTIRNNGHTVQVDITPDDDTPAPSISGGGLSSQYNLAQFHFHWGSGSFRGSEHLLNKGRYAGEIHFVHIKEGLTVDQALADPEGVAVLGALIRAGTGNAATNSAYDRLLTNVEQVMDVDDTADLEVFRLDSLLPETSTFYRYKGSLTTPPCSEAVIWTVFDDAVLVHAREIAQLRQANGGGHNNITIQDNFRPVVPIGSRTVYRNFIPSIDTVGQGHTTVVSSLLTHFVVLLCVFLIEK